MTRHVGSIVLTKVVRLKLKSPSKVKVDGRPRSLSSVKEEEVDGTDNKTNNSQASSSAPEETSSLPQREDPLWRRGWSWWINHPYWPTVSHWIALLLIGCTVWGIVFSMTEGSFVPGTQLFSLLTLFVSAYLIGQIAVMLRLPALLGMLITGIVLRNAGFVHVSGEFVEVTSTLREMALCIILTRAGLGLDPSALKTLSIMVMRLACIPSLIECTFTTVLTHYLLGLPWLWGILLGSILAAVSPAVVIPCLFSLAQQGYGTDKGIPTLVVAAASFDDILAVSAFGVFLSVIFATGDLTTTIIQGPVGVLLGIVFGLMWGCLAIQVPHRDDKNLVLLRSLMVGGGGLVAILGSTQFGYQGAGPLGCIVLAFVACVGWRRQGWSGSDNPVSKVFEVVWAVFQPVLFGLIGSEVDVTVLEGSIVGFGVLSLFIALFARIVVSVFVAYGGGFNWKEKVFVALAWFPKATVQAALGPVALDIARTSGTEEQQAYAGRVLIVAVLAILLTAPAGAVLITLLGPKMLTKVTSPATEPTSDVNSTEENTRSAIPSSSTAERKEDMSR